MAEKTPSQVAGSGREHKQPAHLEDPTYNVRGQFTGVSMPRPTGRQTRTFNYNATTGRLDSATNPENGTVNYFYNADGTPDYKTDRNQKIDYFYDSYKRVIQI